MTKALLLTSFFVLLGLIFQGNIISMFDIPWSIINDFMDLVVSSLAWFFYFSDLIFVTGTLKDCFLFMTLAYLFYFQLRLVVYIWDWIAKF